MELGMMLPLGAMVLAVAIIAATVMSLTGQRRRERDARALEDIAPTPANLLTADAAAKVARGECRFCTRPAEYRTPVIRHARPWGDGLLRWMGLVPQVRFQLEIPRDLGAQVELCDLHNHRSASLLGAEIASAAADQAKFTDSLTRRLISFQSTELQGKLEADTVADSKRKRKTAPGPASVVSITSAKASNGA